MQNQTNAEPEFFNILIQNQLRKGQSKQLQTGTKKTSTTKEAK
jgi:hypothetical protein